MMSSRIRTVGRAIGPDQLDPLGEREPPGPGPWRRAHYAEWTVARVFERVRHMPVERYEAWPQVPHHGLAAGTQHAADLGQSGPRIGPMVHRQRADDDVE